MKGGFDGKTHHNASGNREEQYKAFPTKNAAFGKSHRLEGLEAAVRKAERQEEHQSQHGRLVHILMENGKRCDKWVQVDFNARSGFSKRLDPKGQGEMKC